MQSLYVFRNIQPVLSSEDLINVILSKTQRKTPTEVHPGYQIQRIRSFYMRKIKFCSDSFIEKLDNIINGFPKLDQIHPFYSDWLNVLYDKDHYKIALGQVNTIRGVIERVEKDYLKLMKYGDSLYRCKTLKIAALGRMCTAIKRLKSSLQYLEEIRKHISRLPAIDPFSPTLLLVGPPNVGKSSFINNITNANVEVSSMPFSTQNLFLGITEVKNVRIQIIDSPGLLDRPLEQRNTIEMQSITALAHLKVCVLFIIDLSETCGYLLSDQLKLFSEISPLFVNKLTYIILNKSDLVSRNSLHQELKDILDEFEKINPSISLLENSSLDKNNTYKNAELVATELLNRRLKDRTDTNISLNSDEDYYRGVRIAYPKVIRNNKDRPSYVPVSVLAQRSDIKNEKRPTLKEFEEQHGGAGVFHFPLQEHHILQESAWKYDIVPEIMDGMNLNDFVDPEIQKRLEELELEEEARIMQQTNLDTALNDPVYDKNLNSLILAKRELMRRKIQSKLKAKRRVTKQELTLEDIEKTVNNKEMDKELLNSRITELKKYPKTPKIRTDEMEIEDDRETSLYRKNNLRIKASINSKPPSRNKIIKKSLLKKDREAMTGKPYSKKPKHLYSGKRGIGKTDRR